MNSETPAQVAWADVRYGWRQLYGGFDEMGISLEWHDFKTTSRSIGAKAFGRGAWNSASISTAAARSTPARAPSSITCRAAPVTTQSAMSRSARPARRTIIIALSLSNFRATHLQAQLADSEGELTPEMREIVFPEERPKRRLSAATDVGKAARDRRQPNDTASAEGGADSLVSKQVDRVDVALSLRTEGSGIFLHAPETGGARSGCADEGIARPRSDESAFTGSRSDRKLAAALTTSAGFFRGKLA